MLPQQIATYGVAQQDIQTVDAFQAPNQKIQSASTNEHFVPYIFPGHDPYQIGIVAVLRKLGELSHWQAGWNGADALTPDRQAIAQAYQWLLLFSHVVSNARLPWLEPSVSASADGEVALEWWHNRKILTIYCNGRSIEYIRSWGVQILDEMDDGDASSKQAIQDLWNWLVNG